MKSIPLLVLVTGLLAGCSSTKQTSPWETALEDPTSIRVNQQDLSVQPYVSWKPEPLVQTGGTLSLSIEQAVFAALQRNRELRVQTLNPVIAGAFEQIQRGVYEPELFASVQGSEEVASETARATGEQFNVTGNDSRATIGLRQSKATGTDIEVTINQARSTSSRTPDQQEASIGVDITQSLLRGLGPSVNFAAIRQAELNTLASVYELRGYTEAFIAEVEIAYWNYVLAHEEIFIFRRSLYLARRELAEVDERIQVGSLSDTNGALSRGEVARRESAFVDAQASMEAQQFRLARLLNVDANGAEDFQMEATSEPISENEPDKQLETRIELALKSRPDLNEARLRLAQDRLETIVTKNGLLPQLDLFASLAKTGYADALTDAFNDITEDSYDVTVGLRLSQNLGRRASRGRDLLARASREQAAESVSNHEQIVRTDVRLAINEIQRARSQIDWTAEIRSQQEMIVQGEVERLEVGSSTALQVAQARRDLLASRIEEVEALISYRIALVNLYLAEGTLLERRGIMIPYEAIQ